MFTEAYYWDQNDETRASRSGSGGPRPAADHVPGQHVGAVTHYLKAVQAAGTDAAGPVMARMREMPVNDFMTRNGRVREDGRVMRDMYLLRAKRPQDSRGEWDLLEVVQTISADEAFRRSRKASARWSGVDGAAHPARPCRCAASRARADDRRRRRGSLDTRKHGRGRRLGRDDRRVTSSPSEVAWIQGPEFVAHANWQRLFRQEGLSGYPELEHRAADPDWFWGSLLRFFDVPFREPWVTLRDTGRGKPSMADPKAEAAGLAVELAEFGAKAAQAEASSRRCATRMSMSPPHRARRCIVSAAAPSTG